MKVDVEKIRRMIRTEQDPAKLERTIIEMVERAHPVPVFKAGEQMPMHSFLDTFVRKVCRDNRPTFFTWPVTIDHDAEGNVVVILEGSAAIDSVVEPLNSAAVE